MAPTVSEERLSSGYKLSHPPPGEEVYITGISGYFPDSYSVKHLEENLFNKVDLISKDDRRWKLMGHPEIPQRTGKIFNVGKFDAAFFGVPSKQAHTMDPMGRILLEKAYEAIIDAGLNPSELRNTRTGVFIGSCFAESENKMFYNDDMKVELAITGCSRAMLANRISQWLGVYGPSYSTDSACSSSLLAIEQAFRAIRDGHCDAAIVGGANLVLHPYVSLQFSRLGVLSPDGKCKSFDNSANGYARSEAIAACFLQRAKDSRRVHAQLVHAKTNCDGYKEQGITYPAGNMQRQLLNEFYEECAIPPSSIEFVEAHGTGTTVGDPEEAIALDKVFCTGRSEPLLIGSVKSNLGHSEPASGLCSIAKMCIAYNTGYLPPNIHFKKPRQSVPALTEGRIKVVTNKTPWNRGLAGASSFGFGGANIHVLLKNVAKEKVNNGLPSDDLPRIVCVSGRTEAAVARIFDDLESRTVDVEMVKLLHCIHKTDIKGHAIRGYILLRSTPTKSVTLTRDICYFPRDRSRPVWSVYSGIGTNWSGMATQLLRIPVFAGAIQKCHKILEPMGINVTMILTAQDPKIFNNLIIAFIGTVAVQIGITDILKDVSVEPDFLIGYSIGELGCAYADGCLTVEQTILAAYYSGLAAVESKLTEGSMAHANIGYDQVKTMCPPEIEVCGHNSPTSSTISGPADKMKAFIAKLASKGISVEEVNSCGVAYHSYHYAKAGSRLLKYLKQVIPSPKRRSARWLSTSIPQSLWGEEPSKWCSPEYLTNNLMNPVLFDEPSRQVTDDAIMLDITPHALRDVLRPRKNINIPLTEVDHADNVTVLLTALGKLYVLGLNPHLDNIYPHVPFPVSQGTPFLAHLVEWNHNEDWYVTSFRAQEKMKSSERSIKTSITDEDCEYMSGHVVDGRNLYPATGYLVLVWETLSMMMGELYTEVSVVFENVRFQRATHIPKEGHLEFVIMIHKGSGNFEIVESGSSIVTGRIYAKKNVAQRYNVLQSPPEAKGPNVKHLLTKDFYKELRLRGYQYSGIFRGVIGCNVEGTRGRLAWVNNWVTFLDCMLQMKIVGQDTRSLFVPTRIEKLSIDANIHYEAVARMNPESPRKSFEVRVYPYSNVIRASGVEIRGLHASPIPRKIPLGIPVLEKNVFVPNFNKDKMTIHDIIRANIQLILENIQTYKVKSVELIDEEYKMNDLDPLIEIVGNVLGNLPLVQAELFAITDYTLELSPNISVENKKLVNETNVVLFLGANLFKRPSILIQVLGTLLDKCFVISREKERIDPKEYEDRLDIVTMQYTGEEYIVLFRKRVGAKPARFIEFVTFDETYAWIDKVKEEMKTGQKLVIYNQGEEINGLLGLVNCMRKEPGGEIIHGFLISDPAAPSLNPDLELYEEQLDKDLAINVYQNGEWGTYRHLVLDDIETVDAHHAFVNTITIGDLSSLRWLEGPLRADKVLSNPEHALIHVYCASLNFRDIMVGTGRVSVDAVARGRLAQECVQGFEGVGREAKTGKRLMFFSNNNGCANMVVSDKPLTWEIPEDWTFEQAATVPVAYGTVYYAMVWIGELKRGDSVLIHAGSGGVGQAAINVALHYGCEVFTTVGTPEKRSILKKLFPQLKDSNIGNSRDTSFEEMVRVETKGKGVDIVLNSLSDEKLLASVRCLGHKGRFLEIGKFDINNDSPLGLYFLDKQTSFHSIMMDHIYEQSIEFKNKLHDILNRGILNGAVRPLTYRTFEKDEVEKAFRYMAAGKHIGKVIIKLRDEEQSGGEIVEATHKSVPAVPRYVCMDHVVYVIVGGLGGFGLELADWLILRGARKILLTSRRGITTGYQASRLRAWAGYKADVKISTHDITTESGCEEMLKMANAMGRVEAIFNLAVVLKDAIFHNLTPEMFRASFKPKALATMHLDKISQKLCPELKQFVVFSSVSCGRGNAGQTNYGLSNSVMERICESRKRRGLPALAIQWGAIGDVGIVADMQDDDVQLEIGGTLQQRISSCLLTLDKFLKQDAAIVSSLVVAEKKAGGSGCGNIVDAVAQIMCIKDLKTVSQQVSLAELGMDSMMAVEIKQTLEREFEIFLTAQDIRTLSFARLAELTAEKEAAASTAAPATAISLSNASGLEVLMRNFGDEKLAKEPFIYPPTMVSDGTVVSYFPFSMPGGRKVISGDAMPDVAVNEKVMFVLPGLEGCAGAMAPLCKRLKVKACVLQLGVDCNLNDTIDTLVDRLYQTMKTKILPNQPFCLLGYSFGCLPMIKLARVLENQGHVGHLFCIDGSPDFLYSLLTTTMNISNEPQMQNSLICQAIELVSSKDVSSQIAEKLDDFNTFEEKIKYAVEKSPAFEGYSKEFIKAMATSCFTRLKIVLNKDHGGKIKAPITLLRPKGNPLNFVIEDNYGLDKVTDGPVSVHFFEGNHVTIVENKDCAYMINRILSDQDARKGQTVVSIDENEGTTTA